MTDFAFRSSPDRRRAKSDKMGLADPKPSDKPFTKRNMESKVVDEQIHKVRNRFGDEVANKANYGWGVGGDDKEVSVATKVYQPKKGANARVLVSEASPGDKGAYHRWEKY